MATQILFIFSPLFKIDGKSASLHSRMAAMSEFFYFGFTVILSADKMTNLMELPCIAGGEEGVRRSAVDSQD